MKYIFYVIGILLFTLGISFTIQSDLGSSPFDAVLVGCLSINVGLTVGSWEIIIALILICCNSFLKRQRPVLGLLRAVITGIGIDLWLFLLDNLKTPELWYRPIGCP